MAEKQRNDVGEDYGAVQRFLRRITPAFFRRRYARKFFVTFLFVVLVVTLAGVLNLVQIRDTTENEAREELRSQATFHASLQSQWVGNMETQTQLISSTTDPKSLRGRFSTLSLSDTAWQSSASIVGIHYVNASQDRLVASTELNYSNRSLGTVDAPWVQTLNGVDLSEHSNSTVWRTDVSYMHDGKRVIGFVSPAPTGDDAVVVVGSNQAVLQKVGDGGQRTTVLDADGQRIFGAEFDLTGQSRSPFRSVRESDTPRVVDGRSTLRAYAPVTGTNWVVAVSTPKTSAFDAVRAVGETLVWNVGITVLVLIGVAFAFGRHTVLPLVRLRKRTQQLAERNFDIDLSTSRIDEIGRLYEDFGTMRDALQQQIQETREAKEEIEAQRDNLERLNTRLELALDVTDTGVWEWSLDTDEVIWDEASERLFGYEPGEFPGTFEAFADRVPDEDLERVQQQIDAALETGAQYSADFRVCPPDGDQRWVQAWGVVRHDDDGEPERMLGIQTDITDRKEREQELEQTKHDLEQSNEKLEQFAGVVSHDLRNPLNAAKLRLDFLDDDEHVTAIERNLDRMETMIEELLTLSRAGETVEAAEQVSLAAVAAESWEIARTADADIELQVPETVTVRADRDRLQHVFENLFRNAVDHNDLPLTIRVGPLDGSEATDGGSSPTGFFVEDDGDGIPEAERDQVFDHGYTTSDDGTGFGLSIVRDVVEAHDWTVSVVESNEGGARFEITTDGSS